MAVELNERQREAVMHGDGPLLVLAGAGSGKTRVITTRIATLVGDGTRAVAILALTFTNKAASEMRHRLAALLGAQAPNLWMSTFHSAAAQILRRHIHHLGYTVELLDLRRPGLHQAAAPVHGRRGHQRAGGHACGHRVGDRPGQERGARSRRARARRPLAGDAIVRVYQRYQRALKRQNAVDFGDLIMLAARVLREQPEVLARYRERGSGTCWSTSTRTPIAPSTCCCGCSRAASIPTSASSATTTSRSTAGAAPSSATSSTSSATSPTRPSSVSSRTTARPRRSSPPPGAVVANNCDRKGKTLWTANPAGRAGHGRRRRGRSRRGAARA